MPEVRTYKYYSGGEWRAAASGRVFDVHEPFSGQLYARVSAGGRDDTRIAVQAAVDAFPGWSQTTPAERATLFLLKSGGDQVLLKGRKGNRAAGFPSKNVRDSFLRRLTISPALMNRMTRSNDTDVVKR